MPEMSTNSMPRRPVTLQLASGKTVRSYEYPNEKEVIRMVDVQATEYAEFFGSTAHARPDRVTHAQMCERNAQRFLGDHWSRPGDGSGGGLTEGHRVFHVRDSDSSMKELKRVTLNRIQGGHISAWATQTQSEHVIRFQPQKSNDRPRVWLSIEGGYKIHAALKAALAAIEAADLVAREAAAAGVAVEPPPPVAGPDGVAVPAPAPEENPLVNLGLTDEQTIGAGDEQGPIAPLKPGQADQVLMMVQLGQLDAKDVVVINDEFRTKVGQMMFDNRYRRANGSRTVIINSFLCGIFGFHPLRIQYHDSGPKKYDFTLENTHIFNVWMDCTREDSMDEGDYFGFDYLISLDKAVATMPQFRLDFEKAAKLGMFNQGTARSARLGHIYRNTNYARKMVQVRVCWMRNQELPMTPAEALKAGLIEEEMGPVFENGQPVYDMRRDETGAVDENGEPVMVPVLDESGQPVLLLEPTGEYLTKPGPALDGGFSGIEAAEFEEMVTEPQVTKPGMTNWPTKFGLREIVILPQIDRVVRDAECAYSDIPFAWNINIPIPYCPLGQGEPQRVEDVQQQINRILTIFGNYLGYFQFPVRYWKASVLQACRAKGVMLSAHPGQNVPIPDQDYEELVKHGRMNLQQDVAIMPPLMMQVLSLLLREMDRVMGHVDVTQGVAPAGVTSGVALDTLKNEAKGPQAAKARFTEWMIERTAKIMMNAIVKFIPAEEWKKVLDDLSLPVLRDVIASLEENEFNFYCEVATGRGSNQEREEQRAMGLYANGSPARLMSRRTAMERLRVPDIEAEEKRIRKEDADAAQAAAAAAQAPPAPTPGGGKAKPTPN